jgi:hypothetical protein
LEIIVNTEQLADVMAYDNMINAFISRLLNAVTERNTDLQSHYEKEIRMATQAKSSILTRMCHGDKPALFLVQ